MHIFLQRSLHFGVVIGMQTQSYPLAWLSLISLRTGVLSDASVRADACEISSKVKQEAKLAAPAILGEGKEFLSFVS